MKAMTIVVYPHLDRLLRLKNLTVAELARQIRRRFGLNVNEKTLYRLTSSQPIQRADLEIAGAAAAILDVGLDDLFEIQVPIPETLRGDALDPAQSRRLAELFDKASTQPLSDSDRREMDELMAEYGRRTRDRLIREIARQQGISPEQATELADADFQRRIARDSSPD